MEESWKHTASEPSKAGVSLGDKAYIVIKYTLALGAHALAFTVFMSLLSFGVPLDWLLISQEEPALYLGVLLLLLIMFGVGTAIKIAVFKFGYRNFVFSAFKLGKLKRGSKLHFTTSVILKFHCLIMKVKKARKLGKWLNRGLLAFYTAFIITVPLAANSYADLESDYGNLSEQIARLTASDKSMQLLTFVYGTVIKEIQADPISFAYIENNGDPNSSPYLTGNGLDMSVFDRIRPIVSLSNYSDIQATETNATKSMPDSVMGLFSLFAGYAIVIIMTLALGARMALELVSDGLDSTDSSKNQDVLLKKMITIGASGATSLILTSPLYKGFSLLNLIMFSSLTVGVGITNAFVMNYFEWQGTGATPSLSVNPKSDQIVANVLELAMCNIAYEQSTGDPVEVKVENPDSLNFMITYSACGELDLRPTAGAQNLLLLDFGSDPIDAALDLSAHDETKQNQIREYIRQNYFVALQELVDATNTIAEGITPILTDPGVDEFVRQCDIARSSNFNVSGTPDYFNLSGTPLEICKGNSITNQFNTARLDFSSKINQIVKTAYQLSQNILKIEEDISGVQTLTKSNSAVDINNPNTYKQYIDGWIKYPLFQVLSNNANKKVMALLQMEVEKDLDVKGFGQEEVLADKLKAIGVTRYINQISYDTTAATNAEAAVSQLSTADGVQDLDSEIFNLSSIAEGDGAFANNVARVLAMGFMAESNEHVVGQFVNTGHSIISAYVVASSVVGATSSFLKWKRPSLSTDAAQEAAKNAKGANDDDSAIAGAGRILSRAGIAGMAAGAVVGALGGALDAYKTLLAPLFGAILPFAVFCAFVLPVFLSLMFMATALKWLLQIIKTSLFISVSALKMYSADGREIFGQSSSQILMAIGAVGMMPLLIVASFIAVDLLVTPVVITYQWIIYQVLSFSLDDTAQGPMYIAAVVAFLVGPPVYIITYLYSFPSMAIDSVMQFLSLNLGIGGMSSTHSAAGTLKGAVGGSGSGAINKLMGGGGTPPAGPGGNKGDKDPENKPGAPTDFASSFTNNSLGSFQYGGNNDGQIGSLSSVKMGGGTTNGQPSNSSASPSMQSSVGQGNENSSSASAAPLSGNGSSTQSGSNDSAPPPTPPTPPSGDSNVGSINSVKNSGGNL